MNLLFKIGFLNFNLIDAIDIILVAVLLYQIYKLVRGSGAVNIFLGILAIYGLFLVVKAFDMALLSKILGQFIGVGMLAAIILFQQEIRKFLLIAGRTIDYRNGGLSKLLQIKDQQIEHNIDINSIVKALEELAKDKTGALIAISKSPELKFYIDSGDTINADISKRLLVTIFNKYSPMHDGAAIIIGNKIKAVRCILPVSNREDLPAQDGLRHRAALGLTEITDSVVLIASEETGELSLAHEGEIEHNLSSAVMRTKLNDYLFEEHE
ncbi:diadenylate cyclase CdaA [Cyclobacteriaceae bacterium]|nr:diadenylate cyclase CdaA [Cyclobacteriaceae bacterium]